MLQYTIKIGLTALIVVIISEVGKRTSFWAAVLASLPLTSLLAIVWLYFETGDTEKIAALSQSIFWLVLPSLTLFLLLPLLLRWGWGFWISLGLSSLVTVVSYFSIVILLKQLEVSL